MFGKMVLQDEILMMSLLLASVPGCGNLKGPLGVDEPLYWACCPPQVLPAVAIPHGPMPIFTRGIGCSKQAYTYTILVMQGMYTSTYIKKGIECR